jgi:eukaryotic-like serine/threonine-protein kinase
MSNASTSQFLDGLRAARLLDDARIEQLRARPEANWGDAHALGEYAEEQGWLTSYQANEVREGRWEGLNVGNYRITDRLSDGPGGPTYKAVHPSLTQPVALRLVKPDWLGPADNPETYLARTQAASLVQSPHLTNILDAGTIADAPFVVQESIEGCDLFHLVNEMGALPYGLACEYARQAALALAAAHAKGVSHGAISPLTLLLTPVKKAIGTHGDVSYRPRAGATVKVVDLAVTPVRPPMGEMPIGEGDRLGPVAYLPPEQFTRSDRSPAGDMYGLGATLYYLLTSRPPFAGATAHEAMLNLQQSEPRRVDTLRTDLPPAVAELVHKLLDRNPYSRPSADDVVKALDPYSEPSARPGAVVPEVVPEVPSATETFTQSAAPEALPVATRLDEPPREPAFADDIPEAPPEPLPPSEPAPWQPPTEPPATDGHPQPEVEALDDHHEHHGQDGHSDVFGPGGYTSQPRAPKPKVKAPYTAKQKGMLVLGLVLHLTATCMCLGLLGVIPNPFAPSPPEKPVKKDKEKEQPPKPPKFRS